MSQFLKKLAGWVFSPAPIKCASCGEKLDTGKAVEAEYSGALCESCFNYWHTK